MPTEHPVPLPHRLAYSVEEAAALLGVGRTFMFSLIATGEVESFKIGTRRMIPRGAIDAYIERLRAQQAPPSTQLPGRADNELRSAVTVTPTRPSL